MSVFLPVRESKTGDSVEIELDNLPQDIAEISGMLKVRCCAYLLMHRSLLITVLPTCSAP
jgi:hypothetical protein